MSLCHTDFNFFGYVYPLLGLLDHMVDLFLIFDETSYSFVNDNEFRLSPVYMLPSFSQP